MPAAPLFAFTRSYASQTSHLEILNGFASFFDSFRFRLFVELGSTTQPLRSMRISAMAARYFGVMAATVSEHGGRGVSERSDAGVMSLPDVIHWLQMSCRCFPVF
jgi:hypothetical protein